ncbi:ABC transporter permease [Mesorhizobium sp. M1C.F.Ca.ET.193.01.1.1]|uniref:ABC transporter permease n=1 Tax=unclassified Mesorhizobium TaxID=325217 RepID=UPI000FD23252|nr:MULTISPECIES: ABC transporter permease [unclassified Mesorhizobium]TGT03284.1 ABC transporter permease [bacterium M00.F.Ca.ET.177.01.1.1]TGQ55963.1 ABC transporter permease [Mesorhizobium sp. M1C.F.Ca.ET.210.01.1.1]TGQ75048.1 ABC transporter permease [Mesorhizobium sp. M1C.F.Ca.ET.212.01.1.1]TGR13460.1 ABC transporter permease [Mesorhizobium sp. M1C.F.Ca.ET.204.01.1.1]TGR33736.1 ABC transporter permease [Mesorhizobium sp. M1C.F.Ca.ET.196.01.1.1]
MAEHFDVRRQTGFATVAMLCFLLLYLPIGTLVVYAFNDNDSLAIWKGFSLRWFHVAWNNTLVIESSIRSFQIATVAAALAAISATMAAIATTRTKPYPGLTFKYAFINQPLMVPEIVTAVALLIVFSRIKIWTGYSGLGYLMAAHTAFCVPFAYLPIRARLESMDLSLETAASDLYATGWQTFRYVTLPLLWPGILAGLMLAFVVSLDDVVITEFIKSGGQDTLPTYMLGQLRRTVTPEVNAISTVFLALSIGIVTAFFFISRKRT